MADTLVNAISREAIKTVKKEVPMIEGGWVEFYDDLTGEDQTYLVGIKDNEEGGYELTKRMIADWNFADEKEKKLDISVENIKRLSIKLQAWLATTATSVLMAGVEIKKGLPAT